MAEQKPRLVMDIVAPPPTPEQPHKQKRYFEILVTKLRKIRFRVNKRVSSALGALVLVVGVFIAIIALHQHPQPNVPDPVPLSIRQSVPFNVYFPDPSKLPAGYSLDTGSFSTGNNAVVYKISHKSKPALVVTVQQKPNDKEIQQFYKLHMPLTIPIKTDVGSAALGVLNSETVISLPTTTNSWLLVAAPLNADQGQLKQVMKSMTLAR